MGGRGRLGVFRGLRNGFWIKKGWKRLWGLQGVMREEYSRDLTNLDLGRGDEEWVGGRIGKFSFRMHDKNIYDTF